MDFRAEQDGQKGIRLFRDGQVFGVLDLDSPEKNRFSDEDRAGLEEFARILEKTAVFSGDR